MNTTYQPIPYQKGIVTTLSGSDLGNVIRMNDELAHWFLTILFQHSRHSAHVISLPPLVLIFSLSGVSFWSSSGGQSCILYHGNQARADIILKVEPCCPLNLQCVSLDQRLDGINRRIKAMLGSNGAYEEDDEAGDVGA